MNKIIKAIMLIEEQDFVINRNFKEHIHIIEYIIDCGQNSQDMYIVGICRALDINYNILFRHDGHDDIPHDMNACKFQLFIEDKD